MLESPLILHYLNLEQSEGPFVQTGRYCTVHIYNILSIPTVCVSNTHWYNLASASINVVSMCACVCLHVLPRVCVFMKLSDMLVVLFCLFGNNWSAMG